MTKEATRERKLAFINSFGRNALKVRLCAMIDELGDDFLNDAQINLMAERQVEDAMMTHRHRMRNRRDIYARKDRAALEEVA